MNNVSEQDFKDFLKKMNVEPFLSSWLNEWELFKKEKSIYGEIKSISISSELITYNFDNLSVKTTKEDLYNLLELFCLVANQLPSSNLNNGIADGINKIRNRYGLNSIQLNERTITI